MPKDKNNGREMTPDEKFRSFFSTTAVDIPEEMTRRDENQPEEKPHPGRPCRWSKSAAHRTSAGRRSWR